MNTVFKFYVVRILSLIGLLFLLSGCFAKSCQQLPTQRIQSITETEWRLVFTNDPNTASRLNNYNFTILSFTDSFDMQITSVKNNQQSGTPEVIGNYNVLADQPVIVAELEDFQGNSLGTTTWAFTLNRKLELTDMNTGATFIFYPFEGIVKPDFQCEFKF